MVSGNLSVCKVHLVLSNGVSFYYLYILVDSKIKVWYMISLVGIFVVVVTLWIVTFVLGGIYSGNLIFYCLRCYYCIHLDTCNQEAHLTVNVLIIFALCASIISFLIAIVTLLLLCKRTTKKAPVDDVVRMCFNSDTSSHQKMKFEILSK